MCTTDAAAVHILAGLRAQRMRSACSAADGVFKGNVEIKMKA